MAVKPIPDGYHTVTPYLYVRGAAAAVEFYAEAFGAVERMRLPMPDGKVAHAEVQIGDSVVMLSDEMPEWGTTGPQTLGGASASICLYVADADSACARAVKAGATVVRPLQNQFYGDRSATVADPFGHVWTIATHVEDVPPEEMMTRMAAAAKPPG